MYDQSTLHHSERDWRVDSTGELRWTGRGQTPCYYCGDVADSIDHVIPRSLLARLDLATQVAMPRPYADTVPCCRDCNCRLNSSYQETLTERKLELKRRLRKRWGRLVQATPEWTEEQLADLADGYFKDAIIAQLALREHVLRRLRW